MKKVVYLGGFFQCEFSMQKSFAENNVEIIFLIDNNDYGSQYWKTQHYVNYERNKAFVLTISSEDIENFLKWYRPDVVIHRFWLYRTFMHINSRIVAKKLGIPFIHLEMEDDPSGDYLLQLSLLDCDLFLYAHDRIINMIEPRLRKEGIHSYFYPYGVSSFEKSLSIHREKEIGAFGHPRFNEYDRMQNLDFFLGGINQLGLKLHVYGNWGFNPWIKNFKNLEIHPMYNFEDATKIMNEHKIAINFETFPLLEGAYSHKMFQTIGCGIPTLTNYRKSVMDLFGKSPNPLFVTTSDEVIAWIKKLMGNSLFYKIVSSSGEGYIHENFDWFKRFDKIMKKKRIW